MSQRPGPSPFPTPFRQGVPIPTLLLFLVLLQVGCAGTDGPGRRGTGEGNAPKEPLRFRPDGTFRIVQFTDTQDDQDIDPRTLHLMEAVLDDQYPDLVVFTGDNVRSGPQTEEDVFRAMDHLATPVERRGIPWVVTFGNHDEDHTDVTALDRQALLDRYMAYPLNRNRPSPGGSRGVGDMHLLIRGRAGDQPIFNLWFLDSGTYSPDTVGGQAVQEDGLPGWDVLGPEQVDWYYRTSLALEEEYGKVLPALAFFHIPLPEFHSLWENRDRHGVVGEKNEEVSSGPFNSGLFAAMVDRGDVVGVFVGHDHVNDYAGDYFGIQLGYSANTGFGTYGLPGQERDRLRGARVFVLQEGEPRVFRTYMVYARNYGIH